MSGNTLPVRASQRLYNLSQSRLGIVLGILLMLSVLSGSLAMLINSYGLANNTTLKEHDLKVILHPEDKPVAQLQISTRPVRMIFPGINLAQDVIDSDIDAETNTWPLSDDKAHFANFTAKFGDERGTMLMYGHNTRNVLQSTEKLRLGDRLVLMDENDMAWHFELREIEIITPEKVGFIYEDVPFRVVIFTCDGWYDEYRRLMYFEPISAHVYDDTYFVLPQF